MYQQESQAAAGALGPGKDFGHYRIVKMIGEGGMGQVFLLEHRELGSRAALKVLRPELIDSAEVGRRFLQEARVVADLNHPHIVQIFDFGREPSGQMYYVMEFLDGRQLKEVRDQDGPFRLDRTLAILSQLAEAMSAVHAKKVVHRDLKPENIFLVNRPGRPDFVKILDFGVAKLARTSPEAQPGTQFGFIIGTPEFMSPEQAGGREVDVRSDIYSLGVLLYWMLSDALPFPGDSFGEIVAKRESGPPPPLPRTTKSGDPISDALRNLTVRCLAKDPADRFQSSDDLLEQLPSNLAMPTKTTGRSAALPPALAGGRGRLALVGGAAILVATALLAFRSGVKSERVRPTGDAPPPVAAVAPPVVAPATVLPPAAPVAPTPAATPPVHLTALPPPPQPAPAPAKRPAAPVAAKPAHPPVHRHAPGRPTPPAPRSTPASAGKPSPPPDLSDPFN